MNGKQLELIQHVIDSLKDPKLSPYYGMNFREAAFILAKILEEVRDYETNTNTPIVP